MQQELENSQWLNKKYELNNTFNPFVQKIEFTENKRIFIHGDLHGDVHSLLKFLESLSAKNYLDNFFHITDKKVHILFLGDYTDCGKYGVETLYTLWRLKIANPDNVHLVRGNHEDSSINYRYGFSTELEQKFGDKDFSCIYETYNCLPVALYIGTNNNNSKDFLLCCHGGLEFGFDPKTLLQSDPLIQCTYIKVHRISRFLKLPSSSQKEIIQMSPNITPNTKLTSPLECGFMWNDFVVNPYKPAQIIRGRGWQYSKNLTQALLQLDSTQTIRIRGIFRAHQHCNSINPATNGGQLMRLILNKDNALPKTDTGIGKLWIPENSEIMPGKLWDGIVCTFNVAPHAGYNKDIYGNELFNFDSYGELFLDISGFDAWKLIVHRNFNVKN